MDYKLKTNIIALIERFSAIIMGIIVCIITYKLNLHLNTLKNYNDLFSHTIDFASIFIGVLMTMIGLLLGYANKEVVKRIKSRNANGILIKYFVAPIVSGFIIVIMSLVLEGIFDEKVIISKLILQIINIIWVFTITFFISSTIRVVYLMLFILKEVFYEDIEEEEFHSTDVVEEDELDFDKDCF